MVYKKIIIVFFLLITGFALTYAQAVLSAAVKDLDGNLTSIEEQATRDIIVLDFWTTWCKPCVKSVPKFVELNKKFSGQISFIGINEDSPRNLAKVKPVAQSLGIDYPVLLDTDQDILSDLLVSSFPTLIILDRDEHVLFTHEGFVTGDELIIEKELIKLLKE